MKKGVYILVLLSLVLIFTGCKLRLKGSGNGGGSGNGNGNGGQWEIGGKLPAKPDPQLLLDTFAEGFMQKNIDLVLSTLPEFLRSRYSDLNKEIDSMDEEYGTNVRIWYEYEYMVDVNDDSEYHFAPNLDKIHQAIKENFENYILPSECYELYGTINAEGSKKSFVDGIEGMCYCNYNGEWRLLV